MTFMPKQPGLMDDARRQAFFQGLTQLGAGLMSVPTGASTPGELNPWPAVGQGFSNMQRAQGHYLDKNRKYAEQEAQRQAMEKAGETVFSGGADRQAQAKALWAAGQYGAAMQMLSAQAKPPRERWMDLPGGMKQHEIWDGEKWAPSGAPVARWKGFVQRGGGGAGGGAPRSPGVKPQPFQLPAEPPPPSAPPVKTPGYVAQRPTDGAAYPPAKGSAMEAIASKVKGSATNPKTGQKIFLVDGLGWVDESGKVVK